MHVAALVVAAGRGERLGHELPKAFVPLAGRALLLHALEALAAAQSVACIVPVLAAADRERWRALEPAWSRIRGLAPAVDGGAERQDSVRAGLEALPGDVDWVAVHDAARPLVRPEAVERVIAAAQAEGAAILAQPVRDTIKRVGAGWILETPKRSELWAAQTPQVFRTALLREALAKARAEGFRGTDDAQLVERLGVRVRVVEGDPANLKITGPLDLETAEALLARRAGRGEVG
jgi:2-C-methyl-D-erythritol 4-phosphate cytidylyltransferase